MSGRNDIMVDIETLGSAPGCVITQIGVVLFDPMSAPGSRIGSGLQVNVDVDDAMRFGLKVSGETLRWWFTEPTQHARERAIASRDIQLPSDVRALPLVEALSSVRSYCAEAKRVWSHGAAFDIPIIDAACSAAGVAPCWEGHRTARDTRTLYDMLPGGTGRPPVIDARKLLTSHTLVPHRALDDALVQAVEVQEAFRLLREKETK